MSFVLEQAVVEAMSTTAQHAESAGRSYPRGATMFPDGVNFSVFSRGASAVELLLFDREDDSRPASFRSIPRRTVHTTNGFTLNDLVSYSQKHNETNSEDNRDGANDNRSCNWGVEGPTDDPVIEKLRNRQVKNFLSVTM